MARQVFAAILHNPPKDERKLRFALDEALTDKSDAATGDYADIPTELTKLRDELPTYLPPEIYQRWQKRFVDLIGRTEALVKAVNSAVNERVNGATDQPPPFEGRPTRGGEPLAADNAMRRIGQDGFAPRAPLQETLARLRGHMARIGQV
jgi:hypothetical protein